LKTDQFVSEEEDLNSRLKINLSLTPEERLNQHQSALDLIEQLRLAMKETNDKSEQAPSGSTRK
jgi:hypothetical protein